MTDKEKVLQEEYILDDQPLDEEDQELLDLIYDRLDIFQQMNQPYHDRAKICREIGGTERQTDIAASDAEGHD